MKIKTLLPVFIVLLATLTLAPQITGASNGRSQSTSIFPEGLRVGEWDSVDAQIGTEITNASGITNTETSVPVTTLETIRVANAAPVATDNVYTTLEETAVTGNVITDDTGDGVDYDMNGDALTAVLDTFPASGAIDFNSDGSFIYTPTLDYSGEITFTYAITSGQSLGSGTFNTSYGPSFDNFNSQSGKLGDLDGDGDLDVFVANGSNQPNTVWFNNGYGFSNRISLGGSISTDVGLGDLDGDGDLDAFVANYQQPNRIWRNNGNRTFTSTGQSLGNSASYGVDLGDLNGDGILDAFVANANNQPNTVWLGNGVGTGDGFFRSRATVGNSDSTDVNLGDVDGDGDLDAIVANRNNQANRVWLNDGSGGFSAGDSFGNSTSYGVDLGDLDGDGDLDAFVANYNQPNRVWLNNGSGDFSAGPNGDLPSSSFRSYDVDLGDVDGDGDLDAFVVNYNQGSWVWLNNNDGTFLRGQFVNGGPTIGVSLGDVDDDGDLDAFVANGGNEYNRVWLNGNAWRLSNTATVTITVVPVPLIWNGGGADNKWSTGLNWVGGVAPTANDWVQFDATSSKNAYIDPALDDTVAGVIINPSYTGVISFGRSLIVSQDYYQDGGAVILDPSHLFSVNGNFNHTGGILQETRSVVGTSTTVNFLQIQTTGGVDVYRGVDLTTTTNDLGSTTVSVKAVDMITEFCTDDEGISPSYGGRCYNISPTYNQGANVTLWALTSEAPANPSVYHYSSGSWQELVNNRGIGTEGVYTWATGDTPSFSNFLMGQTGNAPTAVTLRSMNVNSNTNTLSVGLVVFTLMVLSGFIGWRRR